MPRNKDLKRVIRKRMKKTGESYTASRAHVISRASVKQPPPRPADHAALAGMSDEVIIAKTGRTWRDARSMQGLPLQLRRKTAARPRARGHGPERHRC
jgi:hypothetical protein